MDAHCVPRPGWLEKLLAELDTTRRRASWLRGSAASKMPVSHHFRPDHPRPGTGRRMAAPARRQALPRPAGRLRLHGHDARVLRSGRPASTPCAAMEWKTSSCASAAWLLGYSVIMVPERGSGALVQKRAVSVGLARLPVQSSAHRRAALRRANGCSEFRRRCRPSQPLPMPPASLLASDIWARCSCVRAHRKHDADWFCREFEIAL